MYDYNTVSSPSLASGLTCISTTAVWCINVLPRCVWSISVGLVIRSSLDPSAYCCNSISSSNRSSSGPSNGQTSGIDEELNFLGVPSSSCGQIPLEDATLRLSSILTYIPM